MSQSMELNQLNMSHQTSRSKIQGLETIKLPSLSQSKHLSKVKTLGKRFNSVKQRSRLNRTAVQSNNLDTDGEENKLPSSLNTIADAIPLAIMRKQMTLEKTTDDEEVQIKKLIKVKDPKDYHGQGQVKNEILTGQQSINLSPKIIYGKSYVISISPSQRNYEKKKRYIPNSTLIKKTDKKEFNIADTYENRASCRRIRYKKNWHPVF